jgi:hypothetical protein
MLLGLVSQARCLAHNEWARMRAPNNFLRNCVVLPTYFFKEKT